MNESSNQKKNEDLLLTTADEEQIEQVTNRCAQILDDLTDLRFEQQEELEQQKEEFNLVKEEIDEVASKYISSSFPLESFYLDLLSLPLSTTISKNNSS